ncbi:hypothetical protein, partial [Mycoplana ramosa]|uniref:hypothetical protein n=1 Tax=Mycoplana ramosa TaxID=40837 RepID=UPI0035BC44D6
DMKFITRRYYGNGWYWAKRIVAGVRYEVTIYDGMNIYCENIRCASLSEAYKYCQARIDAPYSI